jgi:hypothetical protein
MFKLRIKVWRVFRLFNDFLGVGCGWGQIEELLKGRPLLRLKLRMQHNFVLQHNRKEFNYIKKIIKIEAQTMSFQLYSIHEAWQPSHA